MIYRGLVLGHLLGDFYLQNDEMVRRKKKEKDILNLHCTVYCLIVAVCSFWFVPSVSGGSYLIYLMVLMATHWGIDYAKNHLNKKDGQCFAFIADQAAHLAILIIPARFFAGSQSVLLYKSVLDCRPWIPAFNADVYKRQCHSRHDRFLLPLTMLQFLCNCPHCCCRLRRIPFCIRTILTVPESR